MTLSPVLPFALASLLLGTAAAHAQTAPPAAVADDGVIASREDISRMTLIKSSDGKAVVRFGTAAVQPIAVGDRIGKTRATVTTIVPGRVVLEDVTAGPDGKPLRAEVVLRDGQTGGRRYLRHPNLDAPVALRPDVVDGPSSTTSNGKKSPASVK